MRNYRHLNIQKSVKQGEIVKMSHIVKLQVLLNSVKQGEIVKMYYIVKLQVLRKSVKQGEIVKLLDYVS